MRIGRRVLVVLGLALVLLGAACTPEEGDAYVALNTLRDARQVHLLEWNEDAYAHAVAWSNHMATENTLSHSDLRNNVPPGWRTFGENVAYGGTLEAALHALESSPPHLQNMLNPSFTAVAIGVVERDGRVWITQVFLG
jgi:uncharacterized protein YkwD